MSNIDRVERFLKDVFIPGVKKETIEHEIEQILTFISFDRDKLIALAASSPRQMKDVEGNLIDWIDYACFEVKEILSSLEDSYSELTYLNLVKNNLDEIQSN